MRSERGGILSKTVLFLVLLGLVAFEGGALVVAKVQADGTSQTAADEAALIYGSTSSSAKSEARAKELAEQGGTTLIDFTIDQQRGNVAVAVRKVASTLLIHRIGPLKKRTIIEARAVGRVR